MYKELIDKIEKYIIETNELVILDKATAKKRKIIHELIDQKDTITSFSVGSGSRRVVIFPKINEIIDTSHNIDLGNQYYNSSMYKEAIEEFKKVIFSKVRKPIIYAQIGYSYVRLKEYEKALPYLHVARELNKEQRKDFKLDGIIYYIENKGYEEETDEIIDANIQMSEDDFKQDESTKYDDIINKIKNNKVTLDEIQVEFNISDEELNLIKLYLARSYYIDSNFTKGDSIIKQVTKAQNKTKEVKRLLNEINTNKKFYKNRKNNWT